MGKTDKLIIKLLSKPKDFTWDEPRKVLKFLGYMETNAGKTSGSRVRFMHEEYAPISLHKPHPGRILKAYQIRQIVAVLVDRGQIK